MKIEKQKKLIVYVTTYGPKNTRSPLGDTVPAKPQHLRKYTFSKFSRPPNIKGEVLIPYRFFF